jgi:hypothetical protein
MKYSVNMEGRDQGLFDASKPDSNFSPSKKVRQVIDTELAKGILASEMSQNFVGLWHEPKLYSLKPRLNEIYQEIEEMGHTACGSTGVI